MRPLDQHRSSHSLAIAAIIIDPTFARTSPPLNAPPLPGTLLRCLLHGMI